MVVLTVSSCRLRLILHGDYFSDKVPCYEDFSSLILAFGLKLTIFILSCLVNKKQYGISFLRFERAPHETSRYILPLKVVLCGNVHPYPR